MRKSPMPPRTARLKSKTRLKQSNPERQAKRRKKYATYLQSAAWKAKRAACIARAGGRCEHIVQDFCTLGFPKWRCPETYGLTAHHLTYARFGHELPEDLRCLCKTHHRLVEREKRPWRAHVGQVHGTPTRRSA